MKISKATTFDRKFGEVWEFTADDRKTHGPLPWVGVCGLL